MKSACSYYKIRSRALKAISHRVANPRPVDVLMKKFLDYYKIKYEYNKVFYVTSVSKEINNYVIVDFYIQDKDAVILVGNDKKSNRANRKLRQYFPELHIYNWSAKNFADEKKMNRLLLEISPRAIRIE